MTPDETIALVRIVTVAHDRDVPDGLAEIWHATLEDLPFGLARQGVLELLQTSPYLPRPADIRERSRLIKQQQDRERAKRSQLDARTQHAVTAATETPAVHGRTGANMIRHVLGRLADAGQDVANGKLLGRERAGDIAEAAVLEWLDRVDLPETTGTRFDVQDRRSWRGAR